MLYTYLLYRFKERYTWNKVTTCVHNILGGQRWVDHYGDVVIKNEMNGIKCKLTYAKVMSLMSGMRVITTDYVQNLFDLHLLRFG